jgi:hypothetical protein
MTQVSISRSTSRTLSWPVIGFGALLIATAAHAQTADDSAQVLKAMSDYIASQK